MKKFNLFAITAIVSVAMISCGGAEEKKVEETETVVEETVAEPVSMDINLGESTVMWKGSIIGGYAHEGTLNVSEGSLEMTGDNVTGGSFTVDMATITPTDSNYSEEHTADMLVGHLSTGDFFLVDSFPTANFVIKSADMAAKTITGDLTVKGVTNEETIEGVSINKEAGEATGTLTFDRQVYGVNYESTMKDMVLSDDIALDIKIKM